MAQSFELPEFTAWNGVLRNFDRTFAGRIFGPDGEVRWVREVDHYHVWWLAEEASGSPAVRKIERRYYLWSYWANGRWAEDRIPRVLSYPVPATSEKDREFILVAEYLQELRVPPDTPETSDHDAQLAAWEDLLNQPRI